MDASARLSNLLLTVDIPIWIWAEIDYQITTMISYYFIDVLDTQYTNGFV